MHELVIIETGHIDARFKHEIRCGKLQSSAHKILQMTYRGADKFLARPGRKQATATKL